MDKAQKQLMDTYFRKRNLAVDEHHYKWEGYEIYYSIKINKLDQSQLDPKDFKSIMGWMADNPEYLNEPNNFALLTNPKYKELIPEYYKGKMIAANPKYMDYFSKDITNSDTIVMILEKQPQLINKFNLNMIEPYGIITLAAENHNFHRNPDFQKIYNNILTNDELFNSMLK